VKKLVSKFAFKFHLVPLHIGEEEVAYADVRAGGDAVHSLT
jgi:hypothetical protein